MDVGYVIAQTATHQWILFSVYHSKHRQQRRREQDIVRICKSEANNLDCARGIVLLKLTTDTHEALRGLSATQSFLYTISRFPEIAGIDVLWDERPAGRAQRDTGGGC